jgi:hypothetical protein
LGELYQKTEDENQAIGCYNEILNLNPLHSYGYAKIGNVLYNSKSFLQAIFYTQKAICLNPSVQDYYDNLSVCYIKAQLFGSAHNILKKSNSNFAKRKALECLFALRDFTSLAKAIRDVSLASDDDLDIAAFCAFACNQTEIQNSYKFCPNPLAYIKVDNINNYAASSWNLIDQIIKELKDQPKIWEPRTQTLRLGSQSTNNLFRKPSGSLKKIHDIIILALSSYFKTFDGSNSIFIRKRPNDFKLVAWSVELSKNGYHTNHIHSSGWLSGVLYLSTIKSDDQQGNIEFSLDGYDYDLVKTDIPTKQHSPKKGDLILFPSSLFHKTIPFTENTTRNTIAFDLVPNS